MYISLVLTLELTAFWAHAFDGHKVSEGPLTLFIAPIPVVTNFDLPQPVRIMVSNRGPSVLAVSLSLAGLVDECRAVGASRNTVTVPAQETCEAEFALAVGKGAYSALYPVRIDATYTNDSQV